MTCDMLISVERENHTPLRHRSIFIVAAILNVPETRNCIAFAKPIIFSTHAVIKLMTSFEQFRLQFSEGKGKNEPSAAHYIQSYGTKYGWFELKVNRSKSLEQLNLPCRRIDVCELQHTHTSIYSKHTKIATVCVLRIFTSDWLIQQKRKSQENIWKRRKIKISIIIKEKKM